MVYAEIAYKEKNSRYCRCNVCWQQLKAAIDHPKTLIIKRDDNVNRFGSQKESRDGKWDPDADSYDVWVAPGSRPALWEIDPKTGGGIAAVPPFSVILWHELIGHGYSFKSTGNGNPHHPFLDVNGTLVSNTYDRQSSGNGAYDPAVKIENEARACLRAQGKSIRDRVHRYHFPTPKPGETRPYQ